jgi:hypothetical protein
LQQGFYSHEPEGVALRIDTANLGAVCGETLDQASICDQGTNILVTGETSCTGSDGNQHLCTRYGYAYDYRGATPGTRVQKGGGDEHIDDLWSQCRYSNIVAPNKTVGFIFKFMLYDLYDVDNLSPMQLTFNATFTAGGQEPTQTIHDLGKISWVFLTGGAMTLMVVTGIQGPPDGAARPREFVASYYLDDPERSHASRLAVLRETAERHLAEWHGQF